MVLKIRNIEAYKRLLFFYYFSAMILSITPFHNLKCGYLIIWFLLSFFTQCLAQTGPAGIGNSSSNGLWLRADNMNQADGTAVASWIDASGNANNAVQAAPTTQPLYFSTSSLNNQPVIRFDGGNDEMAVPDNPILDGSSEITYYVVLRPNNLNGAARGILGKRITFTVSTEYAYTWFFYTGNRIYLDVHTQNNRFDTGISTFSNATNYLLSMSFNGNLAPTVRSRLYSNGVKIVESTESSTAMPNSNQDLAIGALNVGYGTYLGADYAEVIHFNYDLDTAEQIILENYLSAKYGISLGANDLYDEDDPGNGNYDFEVAGIGQFDATRSHNEAQGSAIVRILNPSNLNDNEFMFWGHDGGIQEAVEKTDVPVGVEARFDRVWRVSEVNMSSTSVDVGSVDIRWDLTGLGNVTPGELRLLVDSDNDGIFSDETPISGATSLGGNIYEFSGITALQNNLRFTLATINSLSTPLPIELISFTGEKITTNENLLRWSTASESNNSHFIIEHSVDAKTWNAIGRVEGNGNSVIERNYQLTHTNPIQGINYYRLVQVDFDMDSALSKIVRIENENDHPGFEVYPNPTNGVVRFVSKTKIESLPVIFDAYGKQVSNLVEFKSRADKSLELDFSQLAQGTYVVYFNNRSQLVVKD